MTKPRQHPLAHVNVAWHARSLRPVEGQTPLWACALALCAICAVWYVSAFVILADLAPLSGFDHVMNALVKGFAFAFFLVATFGCIGLVTRVAEPWPCWKLWTLRVLTTVALLPTLHLIAQTLAG